jgi:hypothetical protein
MSAAFCERFSRMGLIHEAESRRSINDDQRNLDNYRVQYHIPTGAEMISHPGLPT